PENVQLPGLDGIAGRVEEAVEPARPGAILAGRPVPGGAPRLRGPPLLRRERHGGAAGELHVADPLLDRRAHLAGLRVEELVTEHEAGGLDADDTALDVHDVADAQLAGVSHVAVRRHAGASRARVVVRAEPDGFEHAEPGVGDSGEIVGDGEMIVVVDLPAGDSAAVGLDPAARGHRDSPYTRRNP